MWRRLLLLAIMLQILLGGCNSMSSTMLTRDESNQFWTRKDGLKGVPITLKIPTHVQLTIFERHFLVRDAANKPTTRLPLKFVVRDFSQEFVYTEKIFTVDFKRPAAGTYNLHLNLTEDQYIQQLQHDVTDNTIKSVTDLVKQLVPGGLSAQTTSGGEDVDAMVDEIQSVVAVGIFEIDAPDFEDQMMAFVNCHLNQSHDAWVAPPNLESLNRTRLSGIQQPSNICEGVLVPGEALPVPQPVPLQVADPMSPAF